MSFKRDYANEGKILLESDYCELFGTGLAKDADGGRKIVLGLTSEDGDKFVIAISLADAGQIRGFVERTIVAYPDLLEEFDDDRTHRDL